MEYIFYGLLALVIILFIKSFLPVKGVRNITVEQLGDKGKQFVDVRTAAEYKAFHIRGFKNIPLHQLEQKASTLAKDKEVVLICQSGVRSMRAAKILKKAGFAKITNVKGGVNAWR